LWYFNSYDLDEAFTKYFADPKGARPPTVYIGFPCTKDTTWSKRYPKCSNCILISDGLWEWFEKWQNLTHSERALDSVSAQEYTDFKESLTKHLLDILYETVPQTQGRVEFYTLGTPLSEVTYLASWHGGSYGTKCLTSMFAPENRKWTTTPYTPVPGVYMAGSDAFLPAVCGAMYGGCFGSAAVMGPARAFKHTWHFLLAFASYLREDDPKLSVWKSIRMAVDKFVNE
jgi:all-trans-retinol 13,14-reductase